MTCATCNRQYAWYCRYCFPVDFGAAMPREEVQQSLRALRRIHPCPGCGEMKESDGWSHCADCTPPNWESFPDWEEDDFEESRESCPDCGQVHDGDCTPTEREPDDLDRLCEPNTDING